VSDQPLDSSSRPTFGWPNVFSPEDSGMVIEDVWPSLYIGADRAGEIARKAENLDWARRAVEVWKEEAEGILKEDPVFIEGKPGGRCGMYRTGKGQHVIFDPHSDAPPWDPRLCRRAEWTDLRRAARVTLCHERTRRLMTSLGFLHSLTGDERYSRWVWRGLGNLVELYRSPPGGQESGNGIVYGGLYEAQCMLQVLQALQLVDDAPGSSEECRRAVEQDVLGKVGEKLSDWLSVMMVHNMSCWGMSALALLGQHLNRPEWVEKALFYEQCGLQTLLRGGIPRAEDTGEPDGHWVETAPFYSFFYSLTALIPLYRIGEQEEAIDDDLRERFEAFFEAPLKLVDSNLDFLTISDRVAPGRLSLTQLRHVYEYATGQVDPERWGPVLAMLYRKCGAPRMSLVAFGWGLDELPAPCEPPASSSILPRTRMVTFRADTERGPATLWFYGGGGQFAGHHHHDKLSVSLHAFGRIIASDLGLPSGQVRDTYDSFLTGTFSHNTLLVNEADQGKMRSELFEVDLNAEPPRAHAAVVGEEGNEDLFERLNQRVEPGVYQDVRLERSVFFDFPIVALIDRCVAPEERRFGFVFHSLGEMVAETVEQKGAEPLNLVPLPDEGYWTLFEVGERFDPIDRFRADWRITNYLYLRLITTSDCPLELTCGRTPGNPSEKHRGTVLARRRDSECVYGSILEVHSGSPRVQDVRLEHGVLSVSLYDGEQRVYSE
ncbi:MAG: heparinase II/III family protein, partial [Planctomycetes bacterium]|nr:heparinase II/III family protein [Planctomycetota bacterium]